MIRHLLYGVELVAIVATFSIATLGCTDVNEKKDSNYYLKQLTADKFTRDRAHRELTSNPEVAVPILIEILSNKKVHQAESCLIEIGDSAVPELLRSLKESKDEAAQSEFVYVLAYIAFEGSTKAENRKLVVKRLAELLSHESLKLRQQAGACKRFRVTRLGTG